MRDMTSTNTSAPRWYGIPVRVLLVTLVVTLLCFAVTLFFGIVGTFIVGAIRGIHPDMRVAYRQIAFPLGMVEAAVVFVIATVMEIRHYRQRKALATIERIS